MTRFRPQVFLLSGLVSGCGEGTGPGGQPIVDCGQVVPTTLSPGEVAIEDATRVACVRLPGSSAGAEYLYLALSAAGKETTDGTALPYQLIGTQGDAPPAAAFAPGALASPSPAPAAHRFHGQLRDLGRALARERESAGARVSPAPRVERSPPVVGDQRTFNVLKSAGLPGNRPEDFVQIAGTARYVGPRVAIYTDDDAPTEGGYTPADLAAVGSLFDEHLHPIDVSAFGSETDIDGNGVVLVLLTDQVTRLAGCTGGQIVIGLFFAVDLLPERVGSNQGEVFYGLMPDADCGVTRERALELLPRVFVHEFQHMINYGQRVIARHGGAEDTWLDEGLSQFAEELAARQVPDERCAAHDCATQFMADNFQSGYLYLSQTTEAYLIGPRQPPLPLTQYGASWLFVRWLVDHHAEDPVLGPDLTQRLVQTTLTGVANVAAATGKRFEILAGEWQLANFLDDHPDHGDLVRGTPYEYTSWDLRAVFAALHQQDPAGFPRPYPLEPDRFAGASYSRAGVLHAGSGQHLLVEAGPGAPSDLVLTEPGAGIALPPAIVPRSVVLRLR